MNKLENCANQHKTFIKPAEPVIKHAEPVIRVIQVSMSSHIYKN